MAAKITTDSHTLPQHQKESHQTNANSSTPQYIGDIERWKCPIDKKVMKEPMQTPCGHLACKSCLERYLGKEKRICPVGEEDCAEFSVADLFPDMSARREIGNLEVKCLYHSYGCHPSIRLKEYEKHIENCVYKRYWCINAKYGCKYTFSNETQLKEHVTICDHNPSSSAMILADPGLREKLESLQNVNKQLLSDNVSLNGKVKHLQRSQVQSEQKISDLKEKVDQDAEKISFLEDQVNKQLALLNIKLAENDLRFQLVESASFNGELIWKICNYTRRKQDSVAGKTLSLYSQPFYTGYHGYKMCGRVYLNGDGMGKGTHISVFITIMRGDYDALLAWPFRRKVTFMILDQSQGGNDHKRDSFRPDPNSSSFQRPKSEMNIASGKCTNIKRLLIFSCLISKQL